MISDFFKHLFLAVVCGICAGSMFVIIFTPLISAFGGNSYQYGVITTYDGYTEEGNIKIFSEYVECTLENDVVIFIPMNNVSNVKYTEQ